MLIDTHTHLYLDEFSPDRKEVIQRAVESGVGKLFLPNIDVSTVQPLLDLCDYFPGICYPMMGLHPGSVDSNFPSVLLEIQQCLQLNSFIAIGEIGIDLYWDRKFKNEQERVFEIQLEWALEMSLPVVIHARDSFREIFKILDNVYRPGMKGVFHSFTGGKDEIIKIREYDFYFGINGIVTFKNSDLRDVVKHIPPERLVLETDSPYLSPVPKRGKRNESYHLKYICQSLSEQLDMDYGKLEALSSANALELFNIET